MLAAPPDILPDPIPHPSAHCMARQEDAVGPDGAQNTRAGEGGGREVADNKDRGSHARIAESCGMMRSTRSIVCES
eukprot:608847-Hanusia_phi.AAC.6